MARMRAVEAAVAILRAEGISTLFGLTRRPVVGSHRRPAIGTVTLTGTSVATGHVAHEDGV